MTAATILNFTIFLLKAGISASTLGFTTAEVSITVLVVAGAVYGIFIWQFQEPFFGFVCTWAFGAIYTKQYGTYPEIATTALVVGIAVGLQAAFILVYYFIMTPVLMAPKQKQALKESELLVVVLKV